MYEQMNKHTIPYVQRLTLFIDCITSDQNLA